MENLSLGVAQRMDPPEQTRKPVAKTYDALVDLTPPEPSEQFAFALVKTAFEIAEGRCWPGKAEPLLYDIREEDASPRLVPGSDFYLNKPATDFIVEGSVYSPGGRPVTWLDAGVAVAGRRKLVRVSGDRDVHWMAGGRIGFGAPEPFDEMPLTWDRAYGGVDWRVEVPEDDPQAIRLYLQSNHPGSYPRNPFGRGYVVITEDPQERVLLPNLEDPEEPLTEDRFLVGDPRLWYRQPLPTSLGWTHPMMWPRPVYFLPGVDAWYPGPEDESMPEVNRGFLERGYRRMMQEEHPSGMHPAFFQEAPHGLAIPGMRGDEEVLFWRLNPDEPEMRVRLPAQAPPRIQFELDGKLREVTPRLNHVVCRPAERRLFMVWAAMCPTPRIYIPGVHARIPVAVRVESDHPIYVVAPPTVKDELARAKEAKAAESSQGQGSGDEDHRS